MFIPEGFFITEAITNNFPGFFWTGLTSVEAGPRPCPRFLLGPVPEMFGQWFFGDRLAPPCGIYTVDDVTLSSDRLLVKDHKTIFIAETGMYEASLQANTALPEPDRDIMIDGEVVLLCGPAYGIYGHWLIDFLPRILLLEKAGFDITTLHYLLPDNLASFAWEWLDIIGIPRSHVTTYDVTRDRCHIRRALIPTSIRGNSRASSILQWIAARLRIKAIGSSPSEKNRNIFVSRAEWGNQSRQLVNNAAIEDLMRRADFEIIHPQTLSLREQISTFHHARVIVGEYGSGMHNTIFAPSGAEVIALRGTEGHPGFLQSGLCEALDQRCSYIFGTKGEDPQVFRIKSDDLDLLEYFLPYLTRASESHGATS